MDEPKPEPVQAIEPPAEYVVVSLRETIAQQNDEIVLMRATIKFQNELISSLRQAVQDLDHSHADSPEHDPATHSHA